MKLNVIKEIVRGIGLYHFFLHLTNRLINKLTFANIFIAMNLTKRTVNPNCLVAPQNLSCRFLTENEIRQYAQDPIYDLPVDFIEAAFVNNDQCFAVFDNDKLASYGWYANRAAPFVGDLKLNFSKDWVYMYRGYTLPQYRGQRIYNFGMATALNTFVDRGYKGLISCVELSNFVALKAVNRIGYEVLGKFFVIRLFDKLYTRSSAACRAYGLKL